MLQNLTVPCVYASRLRRYPIKNSIHAPCVYVSRLIRRPPIKNSIHNPDKQIMLTHLYPPDLGVICRNGGAVSIDRRMLIAFIKHPGQKLDYICHSGIKRINCNLPLAPSASQLCPGAIISSLHASSPCSNNQGGRVI